MNKTRKDNNHNSLVKALKQLNIPFCDLSHVGGGIPDGLIWYQGVWQFVEIKNREWGYGRKGLNANQLEWLSKFVNAPVYILESVDDCIAISQGKLGTLKHVVG